MSSQRRNNKYTEDARKRKAQMEKTQAKYARKYNYYDLSDHNGGYVVSLYPKDRGMMVYCDQEQFWIRSKNPLQPMSESKAISLIDFFLKQDREIEKEIKYGNKKQS